VPLFPALFDEESPEPPHPASMLTQSAVTVRTDKILRIFMNKSSFFSLYIT
jgi:hypothetical protein